MSSFRRQPVGAIEQAAAVARDEQVHVVAGAQIICQSLAAGLVDELTIITAPVLLGTGRRLFEGSAKSIELEHLGVSQSPFSRLHRLCGKEVKPPVRAGYDTAMVELYTDIANARERIARGFPERRHSQYFDVGGSRRSNSAPRSTASCMGTTG